MRILRQSGVYRDGFITREGILTNADSTPTVAVYQNGTADGAVSVTVTNVATGVYKYSFTVPSGYAVDDVVQPLITAVIGGITFKAWGEMVTIGAQVSLKSDALDTVLIESAISASALLLNDADAQLTSINARQALALCLAALTGVLAGAATTGVTIKPGGKPSGNTRVSATVDADGNRSALVLKVPT